MTNLKKFILLIMLPTALCGQISKKEKIGFQAETKLDSIKLALVYGAQAFAALDVTDAVLMNEQAKVTQLMQMVDIKDSMRLTERNVNKQLLELNKALEYDIRKEKRKRFWRGAKNILIGVVVGGGGYYAVTNL